MFWLLDQPIASTSDNPAATISAVGACPSLPCAGTLSHAEESHFYRALRATLLWTRTWPPSVCGQGRTLWLAHAYAIEAFFSVVAKEPVEVKTSDVLAFIAPQRENRATGVTCCG